MDHNTTRSTSNWTGRTPRTLDTSKWGPYSKLETVSDSVTIGLAYGCVAVFAAGVLVAMHFMGCF